MKKIVDYDITDAGRTNLVHDTKVGIIFPNATAGHFLYTFYSPDPIATLHTCRIDHYGTAHCQHRDFFDFSGEWDDESIVIDSKKFQKDFLAHYRNDQLTRQCFENYYLIGIQPSPETFLLHTYMTIFKVEIPYEIKNNTESTGFLTKSLEHQFNCCCNLFNHISSYSYQKSCDVVYTTNEIFYKKTPNTRLNKYRQLNRQHVDNYINFFQKFKEYFTENFKKQYEFEKKFLDKNREKLYI
jgi:hypothetical protein